MADRERCFCGEMSLTATGYCRLHRHMDTTQPRPVDLSAEADSLRRQRDAERRLSAGLEQELNEVKHRLEQAEKLLMLVSIGDLKPSGIAEARRG